MMDSSGGCSQCSSVYRVQVVCSVEGIRLTERKTRCGVKVGWCLTKKLYVVFNWSRIVLFDHA